MHYGENMFEQNGIPILALIIEPLVAAGMLILAVSGFMKYKEKKRQPTLYLTLSFVFYSLGIASSGVGKWLEFFVNVSPKIYFVGGTILIAYCLTAIAMVFLMVFVDLVFLEVGPWFIASVSIINGITLGMMFMKINFSIEGAYDAALNVVIYHALVTLAFVLLLAILSFREARQNKEKLPKIGFTFIGLYGVLVSMVFVLFAVDIVIGVALGDAYTPFYYFAWISAGIGSLFGYVGYIMPDWFKKLIKL